MISLRAAATGFLLVSVLSHSPPDLPAITRDQIVSTAAEYAAINWLCSKRNAHRHYNDLLPGTRYNGLSYNMGGFDSLPRFEQKVRRGNIAGNVKRRCGKWLCIRRDFAGIDCAGFVSRCWGIIQYSCPTLSNISIVVPPGDLQPGDILNSENKHVMLFDRFDEDGESWVYESVAWLRIKHSPPAGVAHRSVDWDQSYVPRRFYQFIRIGDRVKTLRRQTLYYRPGLKARSVVPRLAKGRITDGPVADGNPEHSIVGSVWYKIRFDNGKIGWCPIRHLSLTHESDSVDLGP